MSGRMANTAQNDALLLIFENTTWANMGDATGIVHSTTAGSLYISLHTADPGAAGTQATSEAAYTSYARVAVARSSAGWTTSGSSPTSVKNAAAVTFPAATGGSETETWFTVGRDASSTGEALFQGPLTSSLAVSSGITPSFAINALVVT